MELLKKNQDTIEALKKNLIEDTEIDDLKKLLDEEEREDA